MKVIAEMYRDAVRCLLLSVFVCVGGAPFFSAQAKPRDDVQMSYSAVRMPDRLEAEAAFNQKNEIANTDEVLVPESNANGIAVDSKPELSSSAAVPQKATKKKAKTGKAVKSKAEPRKSVAPFVEAAKVVEPVVDKKLEEPKGETPVDRPQPEAPKSEEPVADKKVEEPKVEVPVEGEVAPASKNEEPVAEKKTEADSVVAAEVKPVEKKSLSAGDATEKNAKGAVSSTVGQHAPVTEAAKEEHFSVEAGRSDPSPVADDKKSDDAQTEKLGHASREAMHKPDDVAVNAQAPALSKTGGTIVDKMFDSDQPPVVMQKVQPRSAKQDEAVDERTASFLKSLGVHTDVVTLDIADPVATMDAVPPMKIADAVVLALNNNYEVRATSAKLHGSEWDRIGAYMEYTPSMTMNVAKGTERSSPTSVNDSTGARVMDSTHPRTDRNLSIRQPLFDPTVIADIMKSQSADDVAAIDLREVSESTAFDTVSVFLKLIQSRTAIRLADQYKSYLDDLTKRMTARVAGGGATSTDSDRIQSRVALAESARVEAFGDYETHLSEFKRLTHVAPSQLKIPEKLIPEIPDDMQKALAYAVSANPSYLGSLEKIDLARNDRNKSFATAVPKVSLQYNKGYTYDAGGSAQGTPLDGVYPVQRNETFMVVAEWTLNGGSSIASGMSGVQKESEMRLRSQDVLARLEQAVRTSYNAINAADKRIAIQEKAIKTDERIVKDFEEQYRVGGRSLFDLLDAYERLYAARLDLMRVVIAKAQAAYQVKREMGILIASCTGYEGK